jgi:hypothetical protein
MSLHFVSPPARSGLRAKLRRQEPGRQPVIEWRVTARQGRGHVLLCEKGRVPLAASGGSGRYGRRAGVDGGARRSGRRGAFSNRDDGRDCRASRDDGGYCCSSRDVGDCRRDPRRDAGHRGAFRRCDGPARPPAPRRGQPCRRRSPRPLPVSGCSSVLLPFQSPCRRAQRPVSPKCPCPAAPWGRGLPFPPNSPHKHDRLTLRDLRLDRPFPRIEPGLLIPISASDPRAPSHNGARHSPKE